MSTLSEPDRTVLYEYVDRMGWICENNDHPAAFARYNDGEVLRDTCKYCDATWPAAPLFSRLLGVPLASEDL